MRIHEYASQVGRPASEVVALVKEQTGDDDVNHMTGLDDHMIEMLDAKLGAKRPDGDSGGESSDLFDGIEPVSRGAAGTVLAPDNPLALAAPPIPLYEFAVASAKAGDLGKYQAVDEPDAIAQAVKLHGLKAHHHQFRAVRTDTVPLKRRPSERLIERDERETE